MNKQTVWARGGAAVYGSGQKPSTHSLTTRDNQPGVQVGPNPMFRKSIQTQSDQAIFHIHNGYRLDLPETEDVMEGSKRQVVARCSDVPLTSMFPMNRLPLKVTLAKGSECLRLLARCRRQRNMAGNTTNADRSSKMCFADQSPS